MHYRFLTTWLLRADVDAVFDAIHDTEAWPQWWPGVRRVVARGGGDDDGVGRRFQIVWRSFLPYDLAFETEVTRVHRPRVMQGTATGELVGSGCWRLYDDSEGLVVVLYEWEVATTKRWMNALGPLGKPVCRWNHDYVMRAGGRGLARRLGAELVGAT